MKLNTLFVKNPNEVNRQQWLKKTLGELPSGFRLLDAGAGELQNKKYCRHLDYVSQDFCQYQGGGAYGSEGLQTGRWDVSRIDLVSDITAIPEPDQSFDVILCSEVLEHIPDPTRALDEFNRLLKPSGVLILTAPFGSHVHMAPYHYCTGFSRYWYEHHLPKRGFVIKQLSANGNWYGLLRQEILRLGGMERRQGKRSWPLAYAVGMLGMLYLKIFQCRGLEDLACFGWHCIAIKK